MKTKVDSSKEQRLHLYTALTTHILSLLQQLDHRTVCVHLWSVLRVCGVCRGQPQCSFGGTCEALLYLVLQSLGVRVRVCTCMCVHVYVFLCMFCVCLEAPARSCCTWYSKAWMYVFVCARVYVYVGMFVFLCIF